MVRLLDKGTSICINHCQPKKGKIICDFTIVHLTPFLPPLPTSVVLLTLEVHSRNSSSVSTLYKG